MRCFRTQNSFANSFQFRGRQNTGRLWELAHSLMRNSIDTHFHNDLIALVESAHTLALAILNQPIGTVVKFPAVGEVFTSRYMETRNMWSIASHSVPVECMLVALKPAIGVIHHGDGVPKVCRLVALAQVLQRQNGF